MNATETTIRSRLTPCGRPDCEVCGSSELAKRERYKIERDAVDDAESDETPGALDHLRDGLGLRYWSTERHGLDGSGCCEWRARFVRHGYSDATCDDCETNARELGCAWALYLRTYDAAWAAKDAK